MDSNKRRNRRPGRPVKDQPIPTDVVRAFIRASDDALPKDSKNLRGLVHALLDRIQQNNARVGKFVCAHIQYLTAVENMFSGVLNAFARDSMRDAHHDLLNLVLNRISGSIAERKTPDHFDSAVAIQRHLLLTFLKGHPYQGNKMQWQTYWEQHRNAIVSMLTLVPCFCNYEAMRPAASWKVPPDRCSSEGEFIELVLADLHKTSSRTIRALLIAASPNR